MKIRIEPQECYSPNVMGGGRWGSGLAATYVTLFWKMFAHIHKGRTN